MECPYCKETVKITTGKEIYPHRLDLYSKNFYQCKNCDARVGCHNGTTKPLGRLANAELREAKSMAHKAFDPIWRFGNKSRKAVYAWLAKELKIDKHKCHIGMFDVCDCKRTIQVCDLYMDVTRLDNK